MARPTSTVTKAEPVTETFLSIEIERDGNIKMNKITVIDDKVAVRTPFVHDTPDIAIGKLNQHLRFLRLSGGQF